MLYAGLDIHKAVFQAVVLDPDSGELRESRFTPSRETLADWAMQWQGKAAAVAIEATTGWRWVARELQAQGFEVHLVDPGRASALRGRRRQPKTDLKGVKTMFTHAAAREYPCTRPPSRSRRWTWPCGGSADARDWGGWSGVSDPTGTNHGQDRLSQPRKSAA